MDKNTKQNLKAKIIVATIIIILIGVLIYNLPITLENSTNKFLSTSLLLFTDTTL